jgi:hypothetical protein
MSLTQWCFFRIVLFACFVLAAGTFASLFAHDAAAQEASETDLQAAIEFVRKTGLNGNFKVLAVQLANSTTTGAMLATAHKSEFVRVFREQVILVTAKYQDDWDRNLALAHLEIFTADELKSLLAENTASPYATKYLENRDSVGVSMRARSETLLGTATTEMHAETVNQLGLK